MKYNSKFIQDLMARYSYPEEAVTLFTKVLDEIDNDPALAEQFDKYLSLFSSHQIRIDDNMLNVLKELAEARGYSEYTFYFVFLLLLTEDLYNDYNLIGIDEKIYYDTMDDLRCKLLECIECEYVPGTFVPHWFNGFFRLERFAYGRFQYEISSYGEDEDFVMKCGHVVKKDDIYINFHIPSSGVSLNDEVRLASYKEAYKHVKGLFPDGNVLFGCGSWLLFEKHREFLPAGMNILKFMDDFELVHSHEKENFGDDWRIFGHYSELPVDQLPRDTKLRKAYAEWVCAGHKTGSGFGLFLFDGEKIVR